MIQAREVFNSDKCCWDPPQSLLKASCWEEGGERDCFVCSENGASYEMSQICNLNLLPFCDAFLSCQHLQPWQWFQGVCKWLRPAWFVLFQDIIQLHVSCPSDKEEEKSTKDGAEKEEKDKNKEKAPRKMLSRGQVLIWTAQVLSYSLWGFCWPVVQLLEAEWLSLLMTVQERIIFMTSFLSKVWRGRGEGFSRLLACAPTDLQASCIVYSDLVAF